MSGHQKFREIIGELTPERRARIDAYKAEARAQEVAYTLGEVRRLRDITQAALAEELGRSQPTISAMEAATDNLLSTWAGAVKAMGGRLELCAVFDDQRIVIAPDLG